VALQGYGTADCGDAIANGHRDTLQAGEILVKKKAGEQ
jgi:hypothetical protein